MKNTYKILFSLLIVTALNSCQKEEGTIYDVLDYEKGAVLRTLNVGNNVLNANIPSSAFDVTVEEQDDQDGALMESVDIYVTLRDLTPDNGTTVAADKYVKTIDASAFTTSPVGLPMATLSATYGETFAALGVAADDVQAGDLFVIELRLNLTDGRVFGKDSAAGIITGGFFSSPYSYNVLIGCSPEPGVYTIDMHDSYGDGWQTTGNGGPGITVEVDGVIVGEVGMCSPYGGSAIGTFLEDGAGTGCSGPSATSGFTDASATITIPVGAESAKWNFPGDAAGEISFEIYGPDGEEIYSAGTGETGPGLMAVTLCLQ